MKKKKIAIIIIELLLVVGIVSFIFVRLVPQKAAKESKAENNKPLATILLASDYQQASWGAAPKESFASVMDAVNKAGKKPTALIMCGDYSNEENMSDYQVSPDTAISEIGELAKSKLEGLKSDNLIFVQGNHDAMSSSISASGLHSYDNYLVYVINTQEDFPWKQGVSSGAMDKVKKSADNLNKTLSELEDRGEKRPLIIAAHLPLNFSARTSSKHTTGDNMYSALIFEVLNKYAKSLNIIYLFGHNHSKCWDSYIGGSCVYKPVGDTILIPDYDENSVTCDKYLEKTLNFTYLNAGYVGYYLDCYEEGASEYPKSDTCLSATVCEIYKDKIVLTRYTYEGRHQLGAAGGPNPYGGNIDLDLIDSKYYSKEIKSPQTITRYQ